MENRFAIITGASRGIGKAATFYFAQKHYDLALISRDKKNLLKTVDEVKSFYPAVKIESYVLDISKNARIEKVINQILDAHNRIDILFNNAGCFIAGTSLISPKNLTSLINTNLSGLIIVACLVARKMQQQKHGYIFNVASLAGKRPVAQLGGYCASKFGVVGFSAALTRELIPYGVKVTAICPSIVATDMTEEVDMPLEEKIQIEDITKTLDYLLNLGPGAVILDIEIHCARVLASETNSVIDYLKNHSDQ